MTAVSRARALRRRMSLPEVMLWQMLRERPEGVKFRRQHPIGPYVVDFYCPASRLVVEVDGIAHEMGDAPARDERRDDWLRQQGLQVIRVPATRVLEDVETVVRHLLPLCGA